MKAVGAHRSLFAAIVVAAGILCGTAGQATAEEGTLAGMLQELDGMIRDEGKYVKTKELTIAAVKDKLSLAGKGEDGYILLYALSKEYETYQCDSAIAYANAAIEAAKTAGSATNVRSAKIQLATCLAKAGIFDEAMAVLDALDVSALNDIQRMDFYQAGIDCCVFMLEYRGGYGVEKIEARKNDYQQRLLALDGGRNSYDAVRTKAIMGLESSDYKSVIALMSAYMDKVPPKSPQMANVTSLLSAAYRQSGDMERWKEYLAMSAISDLASCVRENMSLRILAMQMYEDGDLARANMYIKKSLEDANFYNARLRNVQIAKVIPVIGDAYQLDKAKQQTKLRWFLGVLGVMSMILLIGLFFIIRQMARVRKVNIEMEEMNRRLNSLNDALQKTYERERMTSMSLAEANRVKELFICDFLDICTDSIDKLKTFRRQVNAKLKSGQTANLMKLASKSLSSSQEKENRYASFDKAFLKIYPTFIHEFNLLLKEDQRYPEVEHPIELNRELRIFALVKLGISDTTKIQIFLDYSPRTIYNYRSQIKMRAIDKEGDFDERVRRLCTHNDLL